MTFGHFGVAFPEFEFRPSSRLDRITNLRAANLAWIEPTATWN